MTQASKQIKPTYFLSKEQVFQLAKKYIDENDVDGFSNTFMLMTKQMLDLSLYSQQKELLTKVRATIEKVEKENDDGGGVETSEKTWINYDDLLDQLTTLEKELL